YLEMLRGLKEVLPDTALKGFTSVEIDWFARIGRRDARTVMREMHETGLSSLTGGGAEYFNYHLRKQILPNQISADRYFEIHGIAHEMGLKTQVTMLYGHVESDEDRVDHLLRVRDFQDRTGGFQVFIPLAYHPENNALRARRASGMTDLKVYAVSRLML